MTNQTEQDTPTGNGLTAPQAAVEDLEIEIQKRKQAESALKASKEQFLFLFHNAATALVLFDASNLVPNLRKLRQAGVEDLERYLNNNPQVLIDFLQSLQIIDLNNAVVDLVKADSKEILLNDLSKLLPVGGAQLFLSVILDIDQGKSTNHGQFSGHTLTGTKTISDYKWSVFPDYQHNYGKILLSIREVTAQKEAEDQIRFINHRLQTLFEIESSILTAESPRTIASIALNQIISLVSCFSASVSLFDFERSQIEYLAAYNGFRSLTRSWDMISKQRILATFKDNQALIIDDIAKFPRNIPFLNEAYAHGARSLMAVPLTVREELIGSLAFLSEKKRAFDEKDRQYSQQIADSIAIAIHIAHLFEKEKKTRKEAQTLSEVTSILNRNLDEEEVLELILIQVERVLPYDSASIAMINNDHLEFAAQRGSAIDAKKIFGHLEALPPNVRKLLQDKKPMVIANTNKYPDWITFPKGDYIRSWLGIPLLAKNELIGVLMLDKEDPNYYRQQDLKLASVFANQASIAIEISRLNRQKQQYVEQMERKVEERTRDLSALYEISALSSQQLDLNSILNKALNKALEALKCEMGVILILNRNTNLLEAISWSGDIDPNLLNFFNSMPVENPFVDGLLDHGEPILFNNLEDDPRSSTILFVPPNSSSQLGTPIMAKGMFLGILGVSTKKPISFSQEDITLLAAISDQIGAAIEQDRLRQQGEQLVLMEERERLARDLHDSATQALFSLTLFAEAARERLEDGQITKVKEYLDDIGFTANQVHREMRLLLFELRPSLLKEAGLAGALRQRIETVEARSGISGRIIDEISVFIPPLIEDTLFRVALEGLNNILKHAAAGNVIIRLKTFDNKVMMEISDNGQGFNLEPGKSIGGWGLANMRQRIIDVGGRLELTSSMNEGTTITTWIPIINEEDVERNDHARNDKNSDS